MLRFSVDLWEDARCNYVHSRRFFARHPVVLQIGSNLFVHGGLLPDHAALGLEHINRSVDCFVCVVCKAQ